MNTIQFCTLRWLVLKLQEAVEAFPYVWPVFFRLTASERLDRLPLVFVAAHITTVCLRMCTESERGHVGAGSLLFTILFF